jgi:phenylacetate-CoA ligase
VHDRYQETAERHRRAALAQLPLYLERLSWPRERLREERVRRLRRLLALARERSPWHRRRLAHLDVARLDEQGLATVPPMTKEDLMEHFDDVLTDRRLSLARIEDHLATLERDQYLLGEFHAVVSGGSSGRRGVYLYDWDGWMAWYLTVMRQVLARVTALGLDAGGPVRGVALGGSRAAHVSSAAMQTFRESGPVSWDPVPVKGSLAEQLARVGDPVVLASYPSLLHQLSRASSLAPRLLVSSGEPLFPEVRERLERIWRCPVVNLWASSEAGGMGAGCGRGPGLHLCDDLLVIEPVDAQGRAVPPGIRSAKVYVTNLFNDVLPLIRFEITDEVTIGDEPCACGGTHRLAADVQGRLDEVFSYPGASIHPHLFRARLGPERHVIEYQVRQTVRGAEVVVRLDGPADLERLREELAAELGRAGLERPEVSVTALDSLERTTMGKLTRFVALGAAVRPT